jgi:hypothetical protein
LIQKNEEAAAAVKGMFKRERKLMLTPIVGELGETKNSGNVRGDEIDSQDAVNGRRVNDANEEENEIEWIAPIEVGP